MIARFKKRSYKWSLPAIILLLVLSCVVLTNAKGASPTQNQDPKALGKEFVELLVKGQFSTATKNFDATMKKALPPKKLEETWESATKQAGPFKQQIGIRMEKWLSSDIVYVSCEFEQGPLDVKLVYNSQKQVAGLWFVPTPEDIWKDYRNQRQKKQTDTRRTSQTLAESDINAKIAEIGAGPADFNDVIAIFGQPSDYRWGEQRFKLDDLPVERYWVRYPNSINIFMKWNQADMLEIVDSAYLFNGKIPMGSSLERVLSIVGQPKETVVGRRGWEDGILYKDINGQVGWCQYRREDLNANFAFLNYSLKTVNISLEAKSPSRKRKSDPGVGGGSKRTSDINAKVSQDPTGKWQSVDFVQRIEDFKPGVKLFKGKLFLKDAMFMAGGRTSISYAWTKDWVWHSDGKTKAQYKIKQINGQTYLFLPWISRDVTMRGQKPWYYVLKKISGKDTTNNKTAHKMQEQTIKTAVGSGSFQRIRPIKSLNTDFRGR